MVWWQLQSWLKVTHVQEWQSCPVSDQELGASDNRPSAYLHKWNLFSTYIQRNVDLYWDNLLLAEMLLKIVLTK